MENSVLSALSDPAVWERFYEYKASRTCPDRILKKLREFIDGREYLPVCGAIAAGGAFPLPKRSVISKLSSQKKRVVYTYPEPENTVLKLLTWLLLRKYDGLFAPGLFSFRPGRAAKDAMRYLIRSAGADGKYCYKTDVSDYFNSVPVDAASKTLTDVLSDDPELLRFLLALLNEPRVLRDGEPVTERKGIMAGTPQSAFLANVYLRDMDALFCDKGVPYARYSDDIIVFADTPGELRAQIDEIHAFLDKKGLKVNADKEELRAPDEGFVFLGFIRRGGVTDIAPVSVDKIKGKMRRKARALARWRDRNGLEGEKAAKAFIRVFNSKLFENTSDSELTWTRWFFPVITTDESLREIDLYAQDCLRFLISGKRTKARFDVRYEDLKKLGYRSLVNEYYKKS